MADSPQWLTPEQRQILETLRQTPATTLDLAERLGLEPVRVTRCVHGLQEAGLVRPKSGSCQDPWCVWTVL
jgi:DNA-binding MarR family transcriptional regulator